MRENRVVFTTGQIAKICHVAARTVAKWCDSGELKACVLPGKGGDRRVTYRDLMVFLREHGLPTEWLAAGLPRVLYVGTDLAYMKALVDACDPATVFRSASDPFCTGFQCRDFEPTVALVDFCEGRSEAFSIAKQIRANSSAALMALVVDDSELRAVEQFQRMFRKSCDQEKIAEVIRDWHEPAKARLCKRTTDASA